MSTQSMIKAFVVHVLRTMLLIEPVYVIKTLITPSLSPTADRLHIGRSHQQRAGQLVPHEGHARPPAPGHRRGPRECRRTGEMN